ncbi:Glycogen synthase, putative [Brugia malayi]|uniref:Glycogen [starch] synthase n=6 Tax=Brugia TaxID=6278 RepID=A0A4E9FF67_BRUMA|nr:Glycogen synthase, putative [Brugia malayi]VIO94976.1 Glycogen synthase, putative [Brugia malayi]
MTERGHMLRSLSRTKIEMTLAGVNTEQARLVRMDAGETARREGRCVFECSWEVANKVGGIYTVLRSKAPISTEEYGDQYCMLGPLRDGKWQLEVEQIAPESRHIATAIHKLKEGGFKTVYGRWLIDGYPKVILFDLGSGSRKMNDWKHELYERCQIGIPYEDIESNDAVILGFMIAMFLKHFLDSYKNSGYHSLVVAHFHEWQASVGLINAKFWNLDVALIYTTHATLLGRHLAAGGSDLYNNINRFNLDEEAGKRKIYHQYCMERAACHMAHVFTTVSEITGIEAEHLIHQKPDIVTPNGLNVVKFAALHEFQNLHAIAKEKINNFIRGHFHGHYDFDLDKTIYMFTAGRYEFINKGGDIFIESLARLNHYLKTTVDPRYRDVTVVAFIIYPAAANSFNVESLKGQAVAKQLHETIDKIKESIAVRMFESCLKGHILDADELLLPMERIQLKRCIMATAKHELPPVCTHNMLDSSDHVLNALRRTQLLNNPSDRVKVIFHPEFLSSVSPLIGLDYEEFVRGCHLGVFPSYYEPWGYTPAECTVMGVPSVSTNLSGFGCFIQQNVMDASSYGIYVIDRRFKDCEGSIRDLAQVLYDFCGLSRRQRIIMRNRTERLSELLDWKNLGVFYRDARRMALERLHPNLDEIIDNNIGKVPSASQSRRPSFSDTDENDE